MANKYDPHPLLKPGAELGFLAWLTLLGVPAVLLFLIFSKMNVI